MEKEPRENANALDGPDQDRHWLSRWKLPFGRQETEGSGRRLLPTSNNGSPNFRFRKTELRRRSAWFVDGFILDGYVIVNVLTEFLPRSS
ncbi:Hypothetical protein CINCED_3A019134 [Cinara cedri]|uniref:Uncharacterized protein n=1 Tax=Cinara cedri TaxID=506608 RepID=A0A5E4MVB7_9HEMI|nr:Hypothetical protein CINCED_3A019134 [Cinara cedri]